MFEATCLEEVEAKEEVQESNNSHILVGRVIPLINVGISWVILHKANRVVSSSFEDKVDVLTLV